MEDKVPGVKALSFVDDVAWLVGGEHEDQTGRSGESSLGVARRKLGNLRH